MAIETVTQPPVPTAPAYVALALGGDDYVALLSLLNGAIQSLSSNTDAIRSGACLSTALALLEAKDDDPDREGGDLRACVIRLAEAAYTTLQDAQDLGEMGDLAGRLLSHGEGALCTWIDGAKAEALTADSAASWINTMFDVQAFVQGAAAIDGEMKQRCSALQGPLANIAAIVRLLDRTDHPQGPARGEEEAVASALTFKEVAQAQSNAMHDVRAILSALLELPDVAHQDSIQRLVHMADQRVAELHEALDPFV